MSNEVSDVQELFDKAIQIKKERGVNYDNNGKQSYDVALYPYDDNEKFVAGIWPVSQKTARLVSLAHNANYRHLDAEAMNDSIIDLINYAAMYWSRFVKPNLSDGSIENVANEEKDVVVPNSLKKNGGMIND